MADDGYLVGFEDGSGNFVEVGRFNNQAEDIGQPILIRHSDSGNQITLGADGIDTPQVPDSEQLAGETREEVMPTGGIIMWSGSTGNIPTGWTLCDGTDGAPDLRDRFIAGAGGQYNSTDTGGEDSVTLTEGELPSHGHTGTTDSDGIHAHDIELYTGGDGTIRVDSDFDEDGQVGTTSTESAGSHTHSFTTDNTGGDQAHENRPQFYALAFIYKL